MKIGSFTDAHYAAGVTVGTRRCGLSGEKIRAIYTYYTLPALCEGTQIPCGEMTLAPDGRVEVRMLALEPVEK